MRQMEEIIAKLNENEALMQSQQKAYAAERAKGMINGSKIDFSADQKGDCS